MYYTLVIYTLIHYKVRNICHYALLSIRLQNVGTILSWIINKFFGFFKLLIAVGVKISDIEGLGGNSPWLKTLGLPELGQSAWVILMTALIA